MRPARRAGKEFLEGRYEEGARRAEGPAGLDGQAASEREGRMSERWPVALAVGGSDSGGGAGVQADLKTFFSLGVHGVCAIASVTSQNTLGVVARHDLPAQVVVSQVEAVLDDFEVAAAKTGMLATAAVARAVAALLKERGIRNLVVDPVVFSSGGQRLLDADAVAVMAEHLLPLAAAFTPNLREASLFAGREILDAAGMRAVARELRELGPACVVVKGGHLGGEDATDIYYDGTELLELRSPRVKTGDDHGTGCVFSAAIAARLARGEGLQEAVRGAKEDITVALRRSLRLGAGRGPVNPLPRVR